MRVDGRIVSHRRGGLNILYIHTHGATMLRELSRIMVGSKTLVARRTYAKRMSPIGRCLKDDRDLGYAGLVRKDFRVASRRLIQASIVRGGGTRGGASTVVNRVSY